MFVIKNLFQKTKKNICIDINGFINLCHAKRVSKLFGVIIIYKLKLRKIPYFEEILMTL